MKTITIRIEDEVFNKIEELRGLKSKSEFYRKLIEDYLNKPEDDMNKTEDSLNKREGSLNMSEDGLNNTDINLNKSEYVKNILKENESMKAELAHKQELLKMANDWINDMRNLVGFLQFEYQKISGRLALPGTRKWWEFWKK
jgi:predicted CopG family antitoxin